MSTPLRRVLIHPDPLRLESELVALIQDRQSAGHGLPDPTLVLAPTRRLVERLRRVLAGAFPGLLGVEVLHFQGLVFSVRTRRAPLGAPRPLLEALVRECAEREATPLAAYLAPRPRAVRRLTGLFGELREAGLDRLPDADPDLARLYAAYQEALAQLQTPLGGWTDRAGLAQHAMAALGPRPGRVIVYGAHELIGSNLALVDALRPERGTVFLLPVDADAPGWAHARAFIANHLRATPEPLPDPGDERPHLALGRALFSETAHAAPPQALRLVHAQGPEAELTFAARQALAWVAAGAPPHEIAIVARTLEGYAEIAETVFARHGLPVDASVGRAASGYPKATALRLLLEALTQDFPRQTVVDLARSPYLNRPEGPWEPQRWDAWSRTHRVVRGAASWIQDLPQAVTARGVRLPDNPSAADLEAAEAARTAAAASAHSLAAFVAALEEEADAWTRCRSAADHVRFLSGLAERWIWNWDAVSPGPLDAQRLEHALNRALSESVESLLAFDARPGAGAITPDDVRAFMDSALEEAEVPRRDPGGLAFMDVMQARGLAFRHVILLGFNADLMPRKPREDFFLRDRERLRLRTPGKPLSVSTESPAEERLLLAQLMVSATESLTLCWQRADADGKTRSPSLFLRAVARLLPGAPSLRDLLEGEDDRVERIPTHPVEAARWFVDHAGMLTPEEAVLLARSAAGADPHAPVRALLRGIDAPSLDAQLDMVRVVESLDPSDTRYDGDLAGAGWNGVFSPSSLEKLGRCPQQFFFERVLGVRALDERAEERGLALHETGIAFHDVLEKVYRTLDDAGWIGSGRDVEAAQAAAAAALDQHWDGVAQTTAARVRKHLPGLWDALSAAWKDEVAKFVAKDMERLIAPGQTLVGVELELEHSLQLAQGRELLAQEGIRSGGELKLRGRLDRVLHLSNGRYRVSDYKSSGNLENRTDFTQALKANQLQIFVYWLLVEEAKGAAEAELLGVGPSYRPDSGFVYEGANALDPDKAVRLRAGLEETLLILARMAHEGAFPLREDTMRCGYCTHRAACRHLDYATQERQKAQPRYRDYQDLTEKSQQKAPTLAVVRKDRA